MAFYKHVDLRGRKAMADFLTRHFRYRTMNHWNKSTSYAHNMKIYNLPLSAENKDRLYGLAECEDAHERISDLIANFGREHDYEYQGGFNGRSGGYLVLYSGGRKPSGYKSYCAKCYQQNYGTVEASGKNCGRCGEETRRNYTQTHMEVYTNYLKGIDHGEGYSGWDMERLRDRVRLIQEFDKLADGIVAEAKHLAERFEAGEETRMIPKTVKVLKEKDW